MYAWIFRIECVAHGLNPAIVNMSPIIGIKGMRGQMMIKARLIVPPIITKTKPTIKRIKREEKPIKREIKRSMNI